MAPNATVTRGVTRGQRGLSLRLAWLIRALRLIRGIGVLQINPITRILHTKRSSVSANNVVRDA